jgi:chemotaxis protein CheD
MEINIKTGELVIGKKDTTLRTGSVGSCVVISVYDKNLNIGGLAHSMLPTRKSGEKPNLSDIDFEPGNISAKYADEAVDNLIYGMGKMGVTIENMEAKLVGGASMFRRLSGDKNGIGFQNVESARNRLRHYGVLVDNEDTGGSSGKEVSFNLKNGLVEVTTTL